MYAAESLSSITVAALVTAMVTDDTKKQAYTLVVGLGLTGMSVVRHLHKDRHNLVVVDSREQPPGLDTLQREYPDACIYRGFRRSIV
jgi:UDP-N-acetylmuramoylalanine--D-glutamate ligase